jgi:hypothetical protein
MCVFLEFCFQDTAEPRNLGQELLMSAEHDDHGSTPAAWTTVIVLLVGMTISGLALWFSAVAWFWWGMGVCLLGAIVGKLMQSLGYGRSLPAESTTAQSS